MIISLLLGVINAEFLKRIFVFAELGAEVIRADIVNGRTGNPGVVNLHKMASALNMTLAEFLDFKELNDFSFEDNEE